MCKMSQSQWFQGRLTCGTVFLLIFSVAIFSVATCMTGCSEESSRENERTGTPDTRERPDEVERIGAQRDQLDKTVWSKEILAQEYEEPFVRLWDSLRSTVDKYQVLSALQFKSISLGKPGQPTHIDHDIEVIEYGSIGQTLDTRQWQALLAQMKQAGYRLVQSEWHHSSFDSKEDSPHSVVSMTLHVSNTSRNEYFIVKGDLQVEWAKDRDESGKPVPLTVDATRLKVMRRQARPFFRKVKTFKAGPGVPETMLIAHDLDGDGLSELVLPRSNLVYRNMGGFSFKKEKLFDKPHPQPIAVALLAELTGDGFDDLLVATFAELSLYVGDGSGKFAKPPHVIPCVQGKLTNPMVITAGDMDSDGDLDVWLGQYQAPYRSGQMPTPYYDANDGHPAFLLRNDGSGKFEDVTESAGLQAKRFRRTYSASFVDLDDDRDLDLVVVSDFSGVDVYQNNGNGQFTDVTRTMVDERHAFGMSLTFGDYNSDSRLDFLMTGMSSTTARRLHRLGLGRDDFPKHQSMRPAMGYGNRMYLAENDTFRQATFNDQVSRTGWSWGTTSRDFDNDGDRDVYVANGHISGSTAKDYCTRFWCHDIYSVDSRPDPALDAFFQMTFPVSPTSMSWNGFEHNVLLWNRDGQGFANIGFLAGVAFEFDSRNVIGDDLDGDGLVDLLVVSFHGNSGQAAVHVIQNKIETDSNWIGMRLGHLPGSGIGATVRLMTPDRVFRDVVVAGDSLLSQHAPTVHFGLGTATQIDAIEVSWPGGKTIRIPKPAINRYHEILPMRATESR